MEGATMSGLSLQQQIILICLLNEVRSAEKSDPQLLESGIEWRLHITDKKYENSMRASYCRSLARLERRGLITRIKGRKKVRTLRVLLTDQGRKIAEAMTASATAY